MSFSVKVKEELAKHSFESGCCNHAMCYGMLLFGKTFSRSSISILTESKCVAEKYVSLLKDETGIDVEINTTKADNYKIIIEDREQIKTIFDAFSCSVNDIKKRINRGNLQNLLMSEEIDSCCDRAFLSGVFMSCGTISNPKRSYHVEFVVPYKQLSLDLLKVLSDNGIVAKNINRRGVYVVYIKDSTSIENLLNIMGATNSELELIEVKIEKSVINRINRANNFECANIARTASAAADQLSVIERIISKDTFDLLPDDLKQMAEFRRENPDMSLSELGEMFEPSISRSAVNYKLKKLTEFSKKSRDELLELSKIPEDKN